MFCLMLSSWSENTATHCTRGKTQVALQLSFTRNALQVKSTGLCSPFKAYFLSQEFLIHVSRNAFLIYLPCTWHLSRQQRGAGRTLALWGLHSCMVQRDGKRTPRTTAGSQGADAVLASTLSHHLPPFSNHFMYVCHVSLRPFEGFSS